MSVKLLTEHHLEFLSLKGCYTGLSESTLVKMSHCWKHMTWLIYIIRCTFIIYNIRNRNITHLSHMEFLTLISWCSPFLNQGLYDGIYNFYSDFNRTFYKNRVDPDQTPKNKV